MRLLRHAARNVQRQRRRSLLSFASVALSTVLLAWLWAFMDGQNAAMIETNTGHFTGHVHINRAGYDARPSFDHAFDGAELAGLWKDDPAVQAAAPRVLGGALLASDTSARGAYVSGVDPVLERGVTALHTKMVEGRYFAPGDRGGILVGRSMADLLDLKLGSKVGVLSDGMYGQMGARSFTVQGIFDVGNQVVNQLHVFIGLEDAAELFSTGGQVLQVALRLGSPDAVGAAIGPLARAAGPRFEVLGWPELLPDVAEAVRFHEVVAATVMVVVFGIAALGIAGTLMMSVRERSPEFGVMLAMGASPWQVFRGIVYEGLVLSGAGCAVGLVLGAALVLWSRAVGFDISEHGEGVQTKEGLTSVIRPVFSLGRLALIAGVVAAMALLASLYPAARAARLPPVAAIRGLVSSPLRAASAAGRSSRHVLAALAWRNLLRAPFRSGVLAVAIVFCLVAGVVVDTFAQGFFALQKENALGLFSGDLQVMHPRFRKEERPALAFEASPAWLEQLRRSVPQLKGASPRVESPAMLTRAATSEQVKVIGIDPEAESGVTYIQQAVRAGHALRGEREAVLGGRLARKLGVRVGEKTVLTVLDASGNFASQPFVVAGIFELGGAGTHGPDDDIVFVQRARLQGMLGIGSKVTSVAFALHDRAQLAPALADVQAQLPAGDLRALAWPELLPELVVDISLTEPALRVVVLVVYLVAGLIAMNSLLLAAGERTREFGTLLALGASRGRVLRMVALEALMLGAAAVALGMAIGSVLVAVLRATGVTIETGATAIPGVTNVVHPVLGAASLTWPPALMLAIVMLASLYPAWKAARIDPVAAIRRN